MLFVYMTLVHYSAVCTIELSTFRKHAYLHYILHTIGNINRNRLLTQQAILISAPNIHITIQSDRSADFISACETNHNHIIERLFCYRFQSLCTDISYASRPVHFRNSYVHNLPQFWLVLTSLSNHHAPIVPCFL